MKMKKKKKKKKKKKDAERVLVMAATSQEGGDRHVAQGCGNVSNVSLGAVQRCYSCGCLAQNELWARAPLNLPLKLTAVWTCLLILWGRGGLFQGPWEALGRSRGERRAPLNLPLKLTAVWACLLIL